MNGPLSYYRTTKIRFEEEKGRCHNPHVYEARTTDAGILFVAAQLPSHLPVGLPVLHIWGAKDLTARPGAVSMMGEMIPGIEVIELPEKQHWIMVGAKEEVTQAVLTWLAKLEVKARL